MITFRVDGIPKAQPRPRAFARVIGGRAIARVYDAGTAEGWKSQIALAARPCLPRAPLAGPVALDVTFTMPRPQGHYRHSKANGRTLREDAPATHTGKPDLDNLEKAVMDAMTVLGFWEDDSQVAQKSTRKVYGERPGAEIRVVTLSEMQEA